MSARIGRGPLFPLSGDELRPHRALAAPVRHTGDGADVLLADGVGVAASDRQGMAAQLEVNPNRARCRSQSMGKVRISRVSDRPDGSSPLRIASMMLGASVVSFRMRTT